MKIVLFGKSIEPSCQYCEFGKITTDRQLVLCKKKGSKRPYDSCKSFEYAPLKRIPGRSAALPTYDTEDFKL